MTEPVAGDPTAEAAAAIAAALRDAPARCGATSVVGVDGPAGSGKSTLAAALVASLGAAAVVRLDDVYDGWTQPLGAPLAHRIEAWLLLPWRDGLPGRHPVYDWERSRFVGWREVPPAPVMVLDGCGSASSRLRQWLTLSIWVEAPAAQGLARGLARDGSHLEPDWHAWQVHEREHFMADRTEALADVTVDGRSGAIIRP